MNDVGTGKTAASLAGLRLLDIACGENGSVEPFPVMVVAPKSMLRTWEREIRKSFPDAWGPEKRTISIVDGTPAKVRKALEPGFDFYIIGWELIRRYSRHAPYGSQAIAAGCNVDKEINALSISTLIGDEIHRITNPTSQRSMAFKFMAHQSNFRIGLSGTGIEEGAIDLWHIFHCLFPHEYSTKTSYIDRYLIEEYDEWGNRIIAGLDPSREDEFRKNFETRTRRMLIDIIPGLPEVIRNVRWVDLPPKHRKAYNSMRTTLIAEVEGGTLTAPNQLVKASRLVGLANSLGEVTIELDGTETFTMTDDSPKLDALMEDITNGDYEGHQAVVFSDSKQLLNLLATRLDSAKPAMSYSMITGDVTGEARQESMDAFQAGFKQFCLLTRAGGEGITLTAADTLIWLVHPWSFRTDTQAAARCRRIGSQIHKHIYHVDYLVKDTIDEQVVVRLNSKGEAAEEVFQDGELLAMLRDDDPDDEA
jgi:SNF2 family DNA or RNA helicase